MDHRFVREIEKALGWAGPSALSTGFALGSIDDGALLGRLLTPHKLLDLVMRRGLNTPQFRVFQDGSELHPNRYFHDAVTRRGQAIRMADMRRLRDLMRAGCTLVLDEVDFFDPTLEATCRALQWWSRELVQVNAYLTTQEASGFSLHWDDHDVVIVQVAGEKSWEVRGASRPVPMYRDSAPNNEPSCRQAAHARGQGPTRAAAAVERHPGRPGPGGGRDRRGCGAAGRHSDRGGTVCRTDPGVVLGLYRSGYDRQLLEGALILGVRALDTGYNYRNFTAHRTLADVAGDLLPQFHISTKVGFFSGIHRAEHSLAPRRLRTALEETAQDLGRSPDLVFLHNPEHSLVGLPPQAASAALTEACDALEQAVESGLCLAWGIASWNPIALLGAVNGAPAPSALMVRAGLLVDESTLVASEALAAGFGLGVEGRWGMAPLGAAPRTPYGTTSTRVRSLLPTRNARTSRPRFALPSFSPGRTRRGWHQPY